MSRLPYIWAECYPTRLSQRIWECRFRGKISCLRLCIAWPSTASLLCSVRSHSRCRRWPITVRRNGRFGLTTRPIALSKAAFLPRQARASQRSRSRPLQIQPCSSQITGPTRHVAGNLTGKSISATVSDWGGPFTYYGEGNPSINPCPGTATVRLYFQTSSPAAFSETDYWWSNPVSLPLNGLTTPDPNGSAAQSG